VRLTWQNLSDGKRHGFFSGRAWLWLRHEPRSRFVRFEWHHTARPGALAAEVSTGGGDANDELSFRLSLVFVSYYLTFVGFLRPRRHERTTGLALYGDHLTLRWRCDDSSWSRKTGPAAGRTWSAFLLDKLLGRAVYRQGEPIVYRLWINMPEGEYAGTCRIRDDSWKRPLWFRTTIRRADVTMDPGHEIPIPGKGENSWDQDEDALFSSTFPCGSLADAIAEMHASAMRQRRRRASEHWRPTRGPYAPRGSSRVGRLN
jgi:hypothetical protein